jgi:hypothetical protein
VVQLAEVTEHTRRGARGLILPAASEIGSPNESDLLPATGSELDRLGIRPREVAVDGGFQTKATTDALTPLHPERIHIAGRASPGSRHTQRRLARHRVGIEGRTSHPKHGRGLRRSRLKRAHGEHTWTGWAVFTHNLDTHAAHAPGGKPGADPKHTTARPNRHRTSPTQPPRPSIRGK